MSPATPPAERIGRVAGFGLSDHADGYLYRPVNVDGIREAFESARLAGRQIVLRGAGRSYGDAAIGDECIVLDITRMNRVLNWDPATGVIEVEAGATVETLWRTCLEDGWWPPVVSGTMAPTMAGALAMNIHGKNNYHVGTLGEHVVELDVLLPSGELRKLTPDDELFFSVVSGFGSLGVITRVKLQMRRVPSGNLSVLPLACRGWQDQFAAFEQHEGDADYMVSWIDCFGQGAGTGRGQFHAAWYAEGPPTSLRPESQDLPDTILGFYPKSVVWRMLRHLNNRWGMKLVNAAKYHAGRILGDGRPHEQSLVGFSFLLDYVPNWRNAYLPGGFIQYQSFVPKEHAARVFAEQIRMQQEAGLVSFLGVLKRHRPDRFLFSHAVDGYSLALDFKVTERNRARLWALCHRMNDHVLAAGGRFYLAKDSTLRPSDVRTYLGEEALAKARKFKAECDPENRLTSRQMKRLKLFED